MTDTKQATFRLTEKQAERAREWMATKRVDGGAVGGQFNYEFTPTTIGLIVHISDSVSKERLDVTEYNDF